MRLAIEIIWWIGILGALIPTLVILKEVSLLIRTLSDIHTLAVLTREAAIGISNHVAEAPKLKAAMEPAQQFRAAAAPYSAAITAFAKTIKR